jgi:hypothetical protein
VRNGPIGCGVDHAHLHLVPFQHSLIPLIDAVSPTPLRWESVEGLHHLQSVQAPYVYVEDRRGAAFASSTDIGSQLVRRALAAACGWYDRYDWSSSPQLRKVRRTVERVSSLQLAA